MQNARMEFCGACCEGSYPVRNKSMNESVVCPCGAPFFSRIVSHDNLPTSRRCLIEIPMKFMEDHGSKFDKAVMLQENEDNGLHQVQIRGNRFVGFGFEWRDFAQAHNIDFQELVVFTLIGRSLFNVQIYRLRHPHTTTLQMLEMENVGAGQVLHVDVDECRGTSPSQRRRENSAPDESGERVSWTGVTWLYE